jgi:hypothetical protein
MEIIAVNADLRTIWNIQIQNTELLTVVAAGICSYHSALNNFFFNFSV